jgi:hypothetical protein
MKERSSLNSNNVTKTASQSSTVSSTSTTTASNTSVASTNEAKNIQDPYNSQNFMAPPIGATVKCVTCLGNNVQGKVIAYDQQTKMLALSKCILFYCKIRRFLYQTYFNKYRI